MELKGYDIDAQLLEKFSALGTTDRDELVNQLIAVLGCEISRESSYFFLELAGCFECTSNNLQSFTSTSLSNSLVNSDCLMPLPEYDLRITPLNSSDIFEGCLKLTIENCGAMTWPNDLHLRSESSCTVARFATQSYDTGRAVWLPTGDESIKIKSIPPTKTLDIVINLYAPEFYNTGCPIVGALTFVLSNNQRIGEILYCSAIAHINTKNWFYQLGVVEYNQFNQGDTSMNIEEG